MQSGSEPPHREGKYCAFMKSVPLSFCCGNGNVRHDESSFSEYINNLGGDIYGWSVP